MSQRTRACLRNGTIGLLSLGAMACVGHPAAWAQPIPEAGRSNERGATERGATEPKPNRYTGATYGLALLGGPAILNDDSLQGRVGFTAGVAARMTGLLQLSDAELGYSLSRSSPTGGAGNVGVLRHGFLMTAGLHPLFLAALGNRWISYVMNSVHIDIGASYHLTSLSFSGESRTRGDVGWQWGGGIDLPLQDPNRGRSLWLGLRYRQVRVNTDLANDRIHNVGEHQLLVTLEHRWNWR